MSGKKRITVDEAAWREAMSASRKLRGVQRDMPKMIEAVRRAQEKQAASDRAAMQARQEELTRQLAGLSERARELEESTARRIDTAKAQLLRRAQEAEERLRGQTGRLIAEQRREFDTALSAERAERERETAALRQRIETDLADRARVLETARTAAADARVLHDAIAAALPHERFAPGQLARLTSRLALAEASAAQGAAQTALAQAQELQLGLGELRAEVELRDAEWRAAHLTAVTAITALAEEIRLNTMIKIADEEADVSADLDVDYWSDGELSKIRQEAESLAARVGDEDNPPSVTELEDFSERIVPSLDERLSDVVAEARTRQWGAQVRVNVAEMVVGTLESATGYRWDGDAAFARDDQRDAFYSKLRHPDDSEIVIEVAPDETGQSCVIRVMSYETGEPDESQRVARVHAIADTLRAQGLGGTPAAENEDPDPAFRDFSKIRQGQAPRSVPERA